MTAAAIGVQRASLVRAMPAALGLLLGTAL